MASNTQQKLREAFGGRSLQVLKSSEIGAGIPVIEGLLADLEAGLATQKRTTSAQTIDVLGDDDALDKLAEVDRATGSLETECKLIRLALDGAREALEVAKHREGNERAAAAEKLLIEALDKRRTAILKAEEHAEALMAALAEIDRHGGAAMRQAAQRFEGISKGKGFSISGNEGQGFRRENVQHEIELFMHWWGEGVWRCENVPIYGKRRFIDMATAWHGNLLETFRMRYAEALKQVD